MRVVLRMGSVADGYGGLKSTAPAPILGEVLVYTDHSDAVEVFLTAKKRALMACAKRMSYEGPLLLSGLKVCTGAV